MKQPLIEYTAPPAETDGVRLCQLAEKMMRMKKVLSLDARSKAAQL